MPDNLSVEIREINEEVFYTCDPITAVSSKDIRILKEKAAVNPRKRVRLCAHLSTEDVFHNMLIVLVKGCFIPPHKHKNRAESFHIIEGKLRVIIFDNDGQVKKLITMGDYSSGDPFFYRLSEDLYHTVIPLSDTVVFHESTNGPFDPQNTSYPSWKVSGVDLENIEPTLLLSR